MWIQMSLHSRHIILIPSQPVFALTPQYYVLSGEAANTNLTVFGLTQLWLEAIIYHTWERMLTIAPKMQF